MRLPDIMELEKFGFYAGFCTSASICTKLTLRKNRKLFFYNS